MYFFSQFDLATASISDSASNELQIATADPTSAPRLNCCVICGGELAGGGGVLLRVFAEGVLMAEKRLSAESEEQLWKK